MIEVVVVETENDVRRVYGFASSSLEVSGSVSDESKS
jgi:hypothetical protein